MNEGPTKSSATGLAENVAGALAYVLGPITGVAFLVLEKESRFVRFHAMQSVLVGAVLIVLNFVLNILDAILLAIPFLGWLVSMGIGLVVGLASLILWLALMWAAYRGQEWELPWIGQQARHLLGDHGIAVK